MKLFPGKARAVLFCFALFAVTGCSSILTPKPMVTDNFKGIHIYSTTSDMQSSFLKDSGSGEHFCDARASDVADTQSAGVGISAALTGQTEGFSESASRGALALGGRTPAVLITRELMYRTCEMIMNLSLDQDAALALYIKTLDIIAGIVKSDTLEGSASVLGSAQVQNVKLIDSVIPAENNGG